MEEETCYLNKRENYNRLMANVYILMIGEINFSYNLEGYSFKGKPMNTLKEKGF